MSTALPITVQMGSLPPAVAWTPQQLADAIAARLSLVTAQSFALFVTGSTAPTSDVGPWFKNGNEWYAWDIGTGAYVPATIGQVALGYWIGVDAPDNNVFQFWISTTAGGSPLALNIFYNGAWTDVYSTVYATLMTTAAFNTAIGSYSTTVQMTAAIAAALTTYSTTAQMNAAIAAAAPATYPAQAANSITQSILIDVAPHKITLDTAPINPAPAPFDVALYRYVAPVTGIYEVSFKVQFDGTTGVNALTAPIVEVYINGANSGVGSGQSTSSNATSWFVTCSGLVSMTALQYLELYAWVQDGTNTGAIDVTFSQFSVHRV